MSSCIIMKKLLVTSCSQLWPFISYEQFRGGMFKLNAKFDTDPLLYLLSHFEYDCHTVRMLAQRCLPPPLTSTVKSPLFMHIHSSSLSLAARLHRYHKNISHYINNGWTFFQTDLIYFIISPVISLSQTQSPQILRPISITMMSIAASHIQSRKKWKATQKSKYKELNK